LARGTPSEKHFAIALAQARQNIDYDQLRANGHTFLRPMLKIHSLFHWRPRAKNFKKSKFLGFFQIFLENKKIRKFAFLRIFGF
jgi:hypothetical protein